MQRQINRAKQQSENKETRRKSGDQMQDTLTRGELARAEWDRKFKKSHLKRGVGNLWDEIISSTK